MSLFRQCWQEALAVRLYHAGAMDVLLLLVHSYDVPTSDIIEQHIAKFDHATIQDMFEVGLLAQKEHGSEASATKLLTFFANKNCCAEAHHLCYFGLEVSRGPFLRAVHAAPRPGQYHGAAAKSAEHHRDCPIQGHSD